MKKQLIIFTLCGALCSSFGGMYAMDDFFDAPPAYDEQPKRPRCNFDAGELALLHACRKKVLNDTGKYIVIDKLIEEINAGHLHELAQKLDTTPTILLQQFAANIDKNEDVAAALENFEEQSNPINMLADLVGDLDEDQVQEMLGYFQKNKKVAQKFVAEFESKFQDGTFKKEVIATIEQGEISKAYIELCNAVKIGFEIANTHEGVATGCSLFNMFGTGVIQDKDIRAALAKQLDKLSLKELEAIETIVNRVKKDFLQNKNGAVEGNITVFIDALLNPVQDALSKRRTPLERVMHIHPLYKVTAGVAFFYVGYKVWSWLITPANRPRPHHAQNQQYAQNNNPHNTYPHDGYQPRPSHGNPHYFSR